MTQKQIVIENETPCLPQEIITNILVRLPVKSLIRFQCVCKDWKQLLKTQSFIAEHLRHSTEQNPLLLVDWIISERDHWHLALVNQEMQALEFQNPHTVDSLMWAWVYSCNGLLCVQFIGESQHSVWLWNPAIRVVRPVPESIANYEYDCFSVGFGFSSIVNDYKIVKLFFSGYFIVQGEVYSLRTGFWREVEVGILEGVYGLGCDAFPCNGAIFWIAQKQGVDGEMKSDVDLILSFDIAREVFALIPFPTLTSSYRCYNTLASYQNKLAIFFPIDVENSESYAIDMWVLEECRDPSRERWSWAKIYTSRPNPYRFIIYPVIIWRNEIVCSVEALPDCQIEDEEESYEGKVVMCNLATDEFNLFDIPIRSYSPDILDYVESLVLLDNIPI